MKQINKKEIERQNYLADFPMPKSSEALFGIKPHPVAVKIVNLIKKEGMTYEEAYASLQDAYNQLKYESNFVQIPQAHIHH
ncbi:hypothetical protein [Lacticaseibacillus paracasei]|uniref:hypothetical protein n=1 Tax=Lacticaseibacillus paracasei TaxID=1597 RepID=UPI0021A4727D|nr:hypothetical protein [Lacticaseibacillus paracasei]MCT4383936.1 hypothetical protein [Lacticaseibacillus paracasei]